MEVLADNENEPMNDLDDNEDVIVIDNAPEKDPNSAPNAMDED